MKIELWKILSFFSIILLIAYRIYPSNLEMADLFEKSNMYTDALVQINAAIARKNDLNAITRGAKIHEYLGNIDESIKFYNNILLAKPLDMDAHTNLLRIYQWTRQPDEVMYEYQRFLARLENEEHPDFSQVQYKKEIYVNLKNIYSNRGDWTNFIKISEKLLKVEPDNPLHYTELIDVYLAKKDINKIISLIKSGLAKFPDNVQILEKSAFISFLTKRYDISLKNCKKLVQLAPGSKQHWINLINVVCASDNKSEVKVVLSNVIAKFGLEQDLLIPVAGYLISRNEYIPAVNIYRKLSEKYPENTQLLKDLAGIYEMQKNYVSSLDLYLRLKKMHPDNTGIDKKIIELYFASNDAEKAEAAIKKLLDKDPGDKHMLVMLAQVYETSNRPEKAAQIYEKLAGADPGNLVLMEKAAVCFMWTQNYKKALVYLEKLTAVYPDKLKFKESLFYAYANTGRFDKAVSIGKQLIDSSSPNEKYKLELSHIYLQDKRFDLAYPLLKDVMATDPGSTEILESYAWCCESAGKKSEAIETYEKLFAAKEPKEEWVLSLAGLYMDTGNTVKAIQLFDNYLSKFPKNFRLKQMLADALVETKQYNQAIELLDNMLKDVPHTEKDKILFKISSILLARNEFKKAETLFVQLYKNNPSDSEVIKYLAEIYWALNNYSESIRFYNLFLKIYPKDYNTHYILSSLYELTGDKSASRYHAGIALENLTEIPQDNSLEKIYARIYQKLSNLSQAMAHYKKAVENDPKDIDLFRDYISFLSSCGFHNMVIEKIESAQPEFKQDQYLQRYLANAYTQCADYDKAVMVFSQLLENNPSDADLKADLAFVFQKKGRWDKSLLLYDEILKSKDAFWERYKEIKKETENLKKTYGFNIKTGYLLIDEIKKDTQVIYSQSQVYLLHNLLARAGFSRYFFHDSNPSALGNVNETISESSVEFEYFLNQCLSVNAGPLMINHGKKDIYTFNLGLTYNNYKDYMFKINYVWNDKEIDPRNSILLGGRTDHLDLQMNWDINPAIKLVAEGIHSNHKFAESARRYGLPTDGGYSNQFVAGADLNLYHDPRIAITYRYFWKDNKIEPEINELIPYKSKIRSHQFGILYDHIVCEKISIYGTAFVGTDDERDMFLKNMGMYGLQTGVRINLTDNFEIGGMYQFNYENGLTSGPGRINYLNIYSTIYF